ncbi:MAG: response regulator [Steroidobacteraceae bacterium]
MAKIWQPEGSLAGQMRRLVGVTAGSALLAGIFLTSGLAYHIAMQDVANSARAALTGKTEAATAAAFFSDALAAQAVVDSITVGEGAAAISLQGIEGNILATRRLGEAGLGIAAIDQQLPPASVAVALTSGGVNVGMLEVTLSRHHALGAVVKLLPIQGGIFLLTLLIASVSTRRIRNTITTPIQELLGTMAKVGQDQDFSVRIEPQGPEELGSLINRFNEMIGQIKVRDQHLAEHRRQLQEQVVERTRKLQTAAASAEHSSRAKGDFLARMSHEIRTPMNGVVGMAELLQNTQLDARQVRMLGTIRRSADALLEIINDILDFSKIEAGKLVVLNEDFPLVEMIEDVCDLLAARAEERKLDLACHIDPHIPEIARGDVIRLRQVVTNLLGNAIKYTEQGHVLVRTRLLSAEEEGIRIRIEVEDTGLGIPAEALDSVFEAFTQVDSFETRKHGGTGLGLAITKQLTELLHGEIGVTSKLGKGSTFWIEVPLSHAVENQERKRWTLPPGQSVLIVEPSKATADAITAMLKVAGAKVHWANTAHRAMDALRSDGPFTLMIANQRLPDMKGPEFLDGVRARPGSTMPVVMLTTVNGRAQADDFTATAPEEWLVLPVRRLRLIESVELALGIAGAEQRRAGSQRDALRSLKLKVLLVEDSPVNQEVACGMLETLGCEVTVASDGSLGMDYALGRQFDVVLMDCQMPLMDGYESTRRIRAGEATSGRKPVPIVALTANALQGDREECLEAGMDEFLSKPFTLHKLQAMLQAVTGVTGEVNAARPAPTSEATQEPLAQEGSAPVLDTTQIDELRAIGKPQIVRQAILLFLKQTAQKLDELDAAFESGDILAVEHVAHAIKSSSLSVGGRRFANVASECEAAAKVKDEAIARKEAKQLRPEFRVLVKALSAIAQQEERVA